MSKLISHHVLTTGMSRHPERSVHPGGPLAPIDFPISVVLLEMSTGYWIFDTGVGPQMRRLKSGLLSRLYPVVVPFSESPEGSAVEQLRTLGIDPTDIERVILSHFHADHIGGMRDFPSAEIVGHQLGLEQILGEQGVTAARHALFDVLLPDDIGSRFQDVRQMPSRSAEWDGWEDVESWQLSSDDSVVAISLPGHARGQFGLLLNGPLGVFHIADASWTSSAITENTMPSRITRLVHDDWTNYGRTLTRLHDLSSLPKRERPSIVPCHCAQHHHCPTIPAPKYN